MTPPVSCAGVLLPELFSRFGEGTKIANKPPANPPLRALGRSKWPLSSPCRKAVDRLGAGAQMQPQQYVVMAVEDGNGLRSGHLRSFAVK